MRIEPMKAASGDLPTGAEWSYEIKWDGIRIVAQIPEATQLANAADAGAKVRLWSTTGIDRSPEFGAICDQLPIATQGQACVLDGEVVALDTSGRADFRMLQRHRTDGHPTVFVVFDLLELHGRDTRDLPLADRLDRRSGGAGGTIRHGAFKGFRDDKDPASVTIDEVQS